MNVSILAHRQRIDALFSKVASVADPATQAEWSKYLCVLVSGFIEESLRVLLEDYTRTHASPIIRAFVSKEIKDITNCKTSRIVSTLQRFDPGWENDFLDQIEARSRVVDEIKNSLDSVVSNRHQIAHGKNVGISYATIVTYYRNVKQAVEAMDSVIR